MECQLSYFFCVSVTLGIERAGVKRLTNVRLQRRSAGVVQVTHGGERGEGGGCRLCVPLHCSFLYIKRHSHLFLPYDLSLSPSCRTMPVLCERHPSPPPNSPRTCLLSPHPKRPPFPPSLQTLPAGFLFLIFLRDSWLFADLSAPPPKLQSFPTASPLFLPLPSPDLQITLKARFAVHTPPPFGYPLGRTPVPTVPGNGVSPRCCSGIGVVLAASRSGALVVATVTEGGPAQRSGLIHKNDVLHQVGTRVVWGLVAVTVFLWCRLMDRVSSDGLWSRSSR